MLRKIRLPGWRLLILAAAIALLPLPALVACGGEEAATPAPTTPPAATATPAPAVAPPPTLVPAATAAPATPQPTAAPATPVAPATPEPTASPAANATPQPTAASATPVAPATPEPAASPAANATPQPTAAPATPVAPATPEPAASPAANATPQPTAAPATPVAPCEGTRGGQIGNCAPEFAGTQEWINSQPLLMQELRGKVVLIDFWTYSCINCIRTLPFLQAWHERYTGEGLVIVGVHTPEFEFEKVYDNVVQATKDMGVAWPVVQDNGRSVWRSYNNRFWPAKYLIDKDGVIRYRHFGEGRYAETEQEIRRLLEDLGAASEALTMPLPKDQQAATNPGDGESKRTPELFAGWNFVITHFQSGRGLYVGQVDPYNHNRDEVVELEIPGEIHPDRIYFKGSWYIGPESVRHARETDDYSDSVVLAYSARSVNAVLTSESGEPYKVRVRVQGQYLTEENKGDDIIIGEDGESYLMVAAPRAYKIIEHPEWMQHQVLELFSMSDDFGLFSFTFGTYKDGF